MSELKVKSDVTSDQNITDMIKEISFYSDEFQLKGTLHLPQNAERPPVVIGSHGFLSDRSSPKQIELARRCNERGIAYFRFDHRGCGESEGEFKSVTSLETRCSDMLNAASAMRDAEEVGNRIGVFGSSFGGAVCIATAKAVNAHAIVTYAAPLKGETIRNYIKTLDPESDEYPDIDPSIFHFNLTGDVEKLNHYLIFHGDSDKVVSPSDAHRIYGMTTMPKRLIMLKNGDHPMSLEENQEKFMRETVLWFKEYLL